MNDLTRCPDPDHLITLLYDDEGEASERAALAAHVRGCPTCADVVAALDGTRDTLGAWRAPRPPLGFAAIQPRPPAWRQVLPWGGMAAAAVLTLAAAAGLAGLDIRYDEQGFALRTGWQGAPPPLPARQPRPGPMPTAAQGNAVDPRTAWVARASAGDPPWRADLDLLATHLRAEFEAQTRAAETRLAQVVAAGTPAVTAAPFDEERLVQRLAAPDRAERGATAAEPRAARGGARSRIPDSSSGRPRAVRTGTGARGAAASGSDSHASRSRRRRSRDRPPTPSLRSSLLDCSTAGQAAFAQGPSQAAERRPSPSSRRIGDLDPARVTMLRNRYHVRQMESVLARAVEHAAELMTHRLTTVSPDVMALAGSPRAQGLPDRRVRSVLCGRGATPQRQHDVGTAGASNNHDQRTLTSLQRLADAQTDPVVPCRPRAGHPARCSGRRAPSFRRSPHGETGGLDGTDGHACQPAAAHRRRECPARGVGREQPTRPRARQPRRRPAVESEWRL